MRFKIDENLPVEVADILRSHGFTASTVHEQALAGVADGILEEVLKREERAFLTLDVGFADIRTYPPSEHYGLIVFRLQRQDKPHLLRIIEAIIPLLRSEPLQQRLWIVEENDLRIRE